MEAMTFIWMFVVLKIPVVMLLTLVWWAAKTPEPAVPGEEDGGSRRFDPHGGPRAPRPPRRGPHAGGPPPAPKRIRTDASGRGARTSR
jgi:hypothetical protein